MRGEGKRNLKEAKDIAVLLTLISGVGGEAGGVTDRVTA